MDQPTPHRIGLYLGALQLFFTLTWTVYVIYLPRLAVEMGIDPRWVLWLLMLDQLVFALCDWATGILADRVARIIGRLGKLVALVTAISSLAFLLLPFIAPTGNVGLFLAITVLWSATSSALRAPPMVLLGKYAPQPSQPWLAALLLLGIGVASAVSPYLGVALRDVDPRLPFALSSISLIVVTLALNWAERALARRAGPDPGYQPVKSKLIFIVFLVAIAILGIGFQFHSAINAAPAFLKFARPEKLQYLMPVFWMGFSLLMLPASWLTNRYGGIPVMALGAFIGAASAWAVLQAEGLAPLVVAQFVAGGAWGCVLMSAVAAALAIGHTGSEGKVTGGMFSIFALMALARIALVAMQFNKEPLVANLLPSAPVGLWLAAGVLLLLVSPRATRIV